MPITSHLSLRRHTPVAGFAFAAAVALAASPALGLRAPDFAPIAQASPQIQVHLSAAIATFLIGAVLMLGPKGTLPHRTLGWTWAATMAVTAVSSLFIRQVNPGGLSFIHAISGWVIIALPAALYAARRHRVRAHRGAMTGMYVGGMFVAGGLAFLPGRILWDVFFA
ncbi:DUF2306 domain-containing protein [Phenylobacterium sp.]|uniref:DUF2306 domain-containing protein n=1 Tax=Phenylobacterium sp. TaxID=1871053 RepID=UPI00286D62F6|nr:DUF2306 domain-containing protein [Phenylobacterium sp.]